MQKTLWIAILTALFVLGSVHAVTLTTYTNYSSWQLAAGTTSLENFSGEAAGNFTSRDFGDFTAILYNPNSSYVPSVTADYKIQLQEWDYNSYLEFKFDNPIVAFGFNWTNTDGSSDKIELEILGTNWVFGPAQSSGFFGVIASGGTFDTVRIGDSSGDGGALSVATLDDFYYTSVNIPEPSSVVLCLLCVAGMGLLHRKK